VENWHWTRGWWEATSGRVRHQIHFGQCPECVPRDLLCDLQLLSVYPADLESL